MQQFGRSLKPCPIKLHSSRSNYRGCLHEPLPENRLVVARANIYFCFKTKILQGKQNLLKLHFNYIMVKVFKCKEAK